MGAPVICTLVMYTQQLTFTQAQVEAFAQLTGDHNPVHLDEAYARTTVLRRRAVHGMLGASVFSAILGCHYPGEGTLYLSQTLEFTKPIYPDVPLVAEVALVEHDTKSGRMTLTTTLKEEATGKVLISGQAEVVNRNMRA